MAPSLQGLIDFILNEIALCGSQGAYSSVPGPTLSSEVYLRWDMHLYFLAALIHTFLVIAEGPDQLVSTRSHHRLTIF